MKANMRARFILCRLFALLALNSPTCVLASDRVNCENRKFSAVYDLSMIPPGVMNVLGRANLADSGQPFQSTDSQGKIRLPSRRFSIGARDSSHLFLAIERGGYNYHVEIWDFERRGSAWGGYVKWEAVPAPASLDQLLYFICSNAVRPDSFDEIEPVSGSIAPDGSLLLSIVAPPGAMYRLEPRFGRGPASRYEIQNEIEGRRPLSSGERGALLKSLEAAAESPHLTNVNRRYVNEFIDALKTGFVSKDGATLELPAD